jgi:hypothetical protein
MWMGESFAAQASGVLQVQAVSFGLVAMVVIPWQMADGLGFPHWNALLALLWLVVAVLLSIILTPAWRIMAPAWARLVAVLTAPAFVLLVERRVFGQCLMNFWKQAGSSLTMAGGVTVLIQSMIINTHILTGWMTLLASTAVSGLVYMVTLWLIGYFDQIERTYLKNLLGRTISPLAAILAR